MHSSSDARSPVELLADEFLGRHKRGEKPTIKEYCDRHPDLAEEIRDVFEALLMVEDLKPDSSEVSGSFGDSVRIDGRRLEHVGDYRILREIGRGGMGVVYEAEQEALGRRVALKVLPKTMASDAKALIRFQREAKAAARLHHTNIVPVFDVGQDGEQFFYAMQLIQGQGLDLVVKDLKRLRDQSVHASRTPNVAEDKSIAASLLRGQFDKEDLLRGEQPDANETAAYEGSLPSSAVLPGQSELSSVESNRRAYYGSVAQIGLQTAGALSYAHARGIIHRDIKPANLLLDSAGNVWVTDFGLAKTGDSGTTHSGDILGTIRYMSPERFRGQCDVRADLYALGLTLYEMLTLKPAFSSADRLKLIEQIRQSEPPTPRSLDARIPRDLETIIVKAIDKDPRRRYQSADELAEDLQRFVADEPIKARRTGSAERLWRWCRRNPAVSSLAASIFLVLGVGIVGTSIGLVRAKEAEAAAQERFVEAEEARAREAERAEGERQAKLEAEVARKKAEEAEALTLADYRASADDAIEQLLGSKAEIGPKERTYLENTLKRWQAFAARQENDERGQSIRAEGHFRVAHLWSQLGRKQEARREYETGRDIWRKLVEQFPAVPAYQKDLANTHLDLGVMYFDLSKHDESRAEYQAAIDILKKLVVQFPAVPAYQADLANSHNDLGNLLARLLGKYDEAQTEYQVAIDIHQKLVAQFPAVPAYQRYLAGTHLNLGNLLADLGKGEEARAQYEDARDLQKKLVEQFPAVLEYQKILALTHNNLGLLLAHLGKHDEARAEYQAAINIRKKLVVQFPAVPAYQLNLAETQMNLGNLPADFRKSEEARAELQAARDLLKKLIEQFPAVPAYRRELANTQGTLGNVLARLGKWKEAQAELQAARELLKKLVEQFPAVPAYQVELGGSYCNTGIRFDEVGKPAESLEWFDLAIRTLKPVHDKEPRDMTARQFLRNSHAGHAMAYDRLRKFAEARKDWDRAIELSPPAEQPLFRADRALSRLQAGMVAEAVAEVAELTAFGANASASPKWSADNWYNFACVYAAASGKIADKKQEYANRAMELLQKAVQAGYNDPANMKTDTDLDSLRGREDFKKLLAGLEKKDANSKKP
ncbi:MAG TPA: serine/threonine-protein kinase [Gemmataceae bacterium]|nr:serine/threonine-protein kinase [Gemmataceae bacterium]